MTIARTPFSYAGVPASRAEDGTLSAGTKVVLLRAEHDGERASVVDGSGLYVVVPFASLRPLGEPDSLTAVRRSGAPPPRRRVDVGIRTGDIADQLVPNP